MWKDIFRVLLKQWIVYTFGKIFGRRQGTGCGEISHTPGHFPSQVPPPPGEVTLPKHKEILNFFNLAYHGIKFLPNDLLVRANAMGK